MMYPLAQRNKLKISQEEQQKSCVQTVAGSIQQERINQNNQQNQQNINKNQENSQSQSQFDIERQENEPIPRRRRPLVRRVVSYFRQAWTGVKSALGTNFFIYPKFLCVLRHL